MVKEDHDWRERNLKDKNFRKGEEEKDVSPKIWDGSPSGMRIRLGDK